MKRVAEFVFIAWFIAAPFSCTHKRYAQKQDSNNAVASVNNITQPYFLFISDIHLDISQQNTDSTTDTGMDLWNAFKIKADSILSSSNPPAFVICTGDLPAHYKCDTSCYLTGNKLQKHNNELRMVLTDLRSLVSKHNVPFCYVPGNNDALAGDYYSFTNGVGQTLFSLMPDSLNPYPVLNIPVTGTRAPCIVSMLHASLGYYSALVIPGLRVVALNSVILDNKYEPIDGISQLDAGNEEMAWLANQLKDAKEKNEKVYIAMHIPPGIDAYKFSRHKTLYTTWALLPSPTHSWLNTFLDLITSYQTTVTGIFYGHTHMDELRLLYDSTGNHVTQIAIAAPGITPQHGNNPGFKCVSFNPVSMQPTDFTTYYTSLPVIGGVWGNKTYSFSGIFNNKTGSSIYNFLSLKSFEEISKGANRIYTVMHGSPLYDVSAGMQIKWVQ